MPASRYSQKNKLPLIRILIAAILGVAIGYYIYDKSASDENIKGTICLVIDDFGFALNETIEGFLQLDENLTLAIIPGTPYAATIGKLADSLGVETIIHMPMETFDKEFETKSEFTLGEKLNISEVKSRVRLAFQEVPGAMGMNNHQGSKATESLQLMKDLARTLKKFDKFFLDSFTNPESRGFITMRRYGVKTELRQVFLDHVEMPDHIHAQLDSLVNLSHQMDVAIGIGHVKPVTLEVLKTEIPALQKKGYRFLTLSKVVR